MSLYKISYGDSKLISFHIDPFPGNCGYRVMFGDTTFSTYRSLTESERNYINRLILHKIVKDKFTNVRMLVLSEVTNPTHWLYEFMKDNKLPTSEQVKINTFNDSNSKTTLSFFSPYNLSEKARKPRKPKSVNIDYKFLKIEGVNHG